MQILSKLIASGLYSGYAPIASGTIASAFCTALWLVPSFFYSAPAINLQIWVILVVIVVGTLSTEYFLRSLLTAGARPETLKDPKFVVIDEFAGMLIALLALPEYSLLAAFSAFIVFRAFDVIKPWPISALERAPGVIGIMADDIAAGVASYLVLLLILPWIF